MRLHKSKQALRDAHEKLFSEEGMYTQYKAHARNVITEYDKRGKGKVDQHTRLRWDLWWALGAVKRDEIIAASVPRDEWVGGYPDVKTAHIDSLLRHVLGDFVDDIMRHAFSSIGTVPNTTTNHVGETIRHEK